MEIKVAVSRLKASGRLQKILITRFKEIPEAVAEMKKQNISGTVKNVKETK